MRIGLVSSGWVPIVPGLGAVFGGGIEAQVYGLAKALTKLCEEVHLITIQNQSNSNKNEDNVIFHRIALPSSTPAYESMSTLAFSDFMFAFKSRLLCKELDIDIAHFNTRVAAATALLKRSKRPLVFTAHNWQLWQGTKNKRKNISSRINIKFGASIERYVARKADKIFAVSNALKRGIVESAGISCEKVEVVPNAVDPEVFYHESVTRTQSVLYVGRLTAEKGVDVLVKAMPQVLKAVPDAKLRIVGPKKYGFEHGSYEDELRQLIRTLKIEPYVELLGPKAPRELRKPYSQASVVCLPSVGLETFGLTLMEAMACETAVIGTRVGGIPEVISEGKDGLLVNPNSVEELAKAIIRILSDDRFAQNLGKNGRKKVLEKYTFDRQAERAYSSYTSLLKHKRAHVRRARNSFAG